MQNHEQDLSILAKKAKGGDQQSFEEILKILDPEIKKLAHKYYIVGGDDQDVIQECRLGVWKAVKDFDSEAGMSFKNFSLSLCVKRHLITAMSHANTQKFRLQNEAISLSSPVSQSEDEGMQTYADYIPDPNSDLLNNYIIQEEFNTNLEMISEKLTKLERSIFGQYAFSSSYKDIADALQVKPKTVDNALMRIRKKSSETYQYYMETHSEINLGCSTAGTSINTSFFIETSIGFTTNINTI
jgi:RNA polymerase sporulation-specific sigma factor